MGLAGCEKKQRGESGDELVMARSRISSSELGARRSSTRSTLAAYSRPITGVTSKLSRWSRAPLSLRGSLWPSRRTGRSSSTFWGA